VVVLVLDLVEIILTGVSVIFVTVVMVLSFSSSVFVKTFSSEIISSSVSELVLFSSFFLWFVFGL